jgi:large subunit ribosomal protein L24
MKLRKNDKIKIVRGKDRGKESVVERVLPKSGKIYAKDMNVVKKHEKGRGIIDVVKPMQASNVMIICPKCSKATRVGFKIEKGKKIRFCKQCQAEI